MFGPLEIIQVIGGILLVCIPHFSGRIRTVIGRCNRWVFYFMHLYRMLSVAAGVMELIVIGSLLRHSDPMFRMWDNQSPGRHGILDYCCNPVLIYAYFL